MVIICRTCLKPSEHFESAFVKKLVNTEYTTIATMISLCIGLEISEYDSISCAICTDCIDFIIIAFKYRKQCWKSHMKLMTELKEQYKATCLEIKTGETTVQQNPIRKTIHDSRQSDDDKWFRTENITVELVDVCSEIQNKKLSKQFLGVTKQRRNRMMCNDNVLPHGYEDMVDYTNIAMDDMTKTKTYRCRICKFRYKRIGSLRSHQENIHRLQFKNQYECNNCGKFFVSQKQLNFHERMHADNQFVCQFCGKKFRLNSRLAVHVRRHTGDKPFGCDQCAYRTITKSDLVTHMRTHTGEKPFKCFHCDSAFSTVSHRAAHVRNHSGERPYKCMICLTAYKTKGVYKSHMDSHDPKKSIVCEVCHHVSSNRKNHMRHIKQHRSKTIS